MKQISSGIADYNAVDPHSPAGYQSPQQYRRTRPVTTVKC